MGTFKVSSYGNQPSRARQSSEVGVEKKWFYRHVRVSWLEVGLNHRSLLEATILGARDRQYEHFQFHQ